MHIGETTFRSVAIALAVTACLLAYTASTWPHSIRIWKMHVVRENPVAALVAEWHRPRHSLRADTSPPARTAASAEAPRRRF